MNTYTHQGHIINVANTNLAVAYTKGEKLIEIAPRIIPKTAKVPYTLWAQLVHFLLWVQATFSSEGLVIGYYNIADNQWIIEPPPQITNGMTVKETPEGLPEYKNAITERGFRQMMTMHTHCTSGAFQSGTDANDEFVQSGTGFHITLGHMDKPLLDLDCRAKLVIPGTLTPEGETITPTESVTAPFELSDFVETPIRLQNAEPELMKLLRQYQLLRPENIPNLGFPEEWKTRVSKPAQQVNTYRPGFNGVTIHGATTHPRFNTAMSQGKYAGGIAHWGIKSNNRISLDDALAILDAYVASPNKATINKFKKQAKKAIMELLSAVELDEREIAPRGMMLALHKYAAHRIDHCKQKKIIYPSDLATMYSGFTCSQHPKFKDVFPAFFVLGMKSKMTQSIFDAANLMPQYKDVEDKEQPCVEDEGPVNTLALQNGPPDINGDEYQQQYEAYLTAQNDGMPDWSGSMQRAF